MHFLVTGGTGFIGTALIEALQDKGHAATVLTRQALPDRSDCRYVNDFEDIESGKRFDGVINLAGASLAGARWSEKYKRELVASRVETTRALVKLLQRLDHTPPLLLSGSAIGYYGHHGDELLAEDGAVVPGFAQRLCQEWEAAALEAEALGVRVCLLRLGVVLDAGGGALVDMARSFQLGIASWLGEGTQWLSWVHRRDVVAAIGYLIDSPVLSGPFNITAPEPVTSRGFCDAMKRHKRTFLTMPVPAPAMRLLVGEMADELLLNGQRVLPAALAAAGFEFGFPTLDEALADIYD
ncbi:MAG: TIGR01777 family oxidoreductase [Halioglobus sp.]|jgi:uncharacterized protein